LIEAQGLAAEAGTDIVDIPWGLGLVRAFSGDYDAAVHLLQSAVGLAERAQDHWAECECLQRLAMIELERGRPETARDRARAFAGVAARMGEGSEAPFAATLEALADMALGDAGAIDRVERTIGALRDVDAKALLASALLFAAAADVERGDLDRAEVRAQEALLAARVVGRRSEIVIALALLARVACRRADPVTAQGFANMAAAELGDPCAVAAYARRAASGIDIQIR